MAAELLDIEAKLDTSQVQGQLSQLSKTSGLQNLDRAIRTLEQSMKRLSQTMDRQAQQTAASGGSVGRSINTEKLLGGRYIKGLGGYVIGRTLQDIGAATGNKTLATTGKLAGSIAKGTAVGSMFGGPVGAGIGAGLGALQFAADSLADSFENLKNKVKQATADYDKANKLSQHLQTSYGERMFALGVSNMNHSQIADNVAITSDALRRARIRESEAQHDLNKFESTSDYKYTLKFVAEQGVMSKEFREQAEMLQKVYDDLTKTAKDAAAETQRLEKRMHLLEQREKELNREDDKTQRQREHELEQRERGRTTVGGMLSDINQSMRIEMMKELAATLTEGDIKSKFATSRSDYESSRSLLKKTLETALNSDDPTQFIGQIKDMTKTVRQLEEVMNVWKDNMQNGIDEQATQLNPMSLFGSTNGLQQMGAYAYKGQEYNYANYFTQIVSKLSRIETNTAYAPTTTQGNTIG